MALTLRTLRARKVARFLLRQVGLTPKAVPKDAAFQLGSAYGIDRLLIIEGFGALASGWLLAPGRHVVSMSLLAGGRMLDGDRGSLVRTSRTDLAAAFPDYADAAETAGFQCMFRGMPPPRPANGPYALRLHLEDGATPYLKLPQSIVRYCDGTDGLLTLTRSVPALANEPFLDDFAAAYAAIVRRRATAVATLSKAPSLRAAILTLPHSGDDFALAAARIRRASDRLPADVGLALILSQGNSHARLLDRAADLRRANRPVSLFEVSDPTYALWSLGPILAALGARRFWFCGPETIPTDAGWARAADALADDRRDLETFVGPDRGAGVEPESLSFAWSTDAFADWAAGAPFFLGGFHRDNHLPPPPISRRATGTIGMLRTMIAAEPLRRADERLYESAAVHNNHEASS